MKAEDSTVGSILAGTVQHIVPVFQSSYRWDQTLWSKFWDDLLAIIEDSDARVSHFIGPLVFTTRVVQGNIVRSVVVDGQQRLITLTVLFCVLRDVASKLDLSAFATSIESNVLTFNDTRGVSQPKIQPKIEDQDTLWGIVKKNDANIDSGALIKQAYNFFYAKLSESIEDRDLWDEPPIEKLEKLYATATQRLRLVRIELDDSDNPSNIFESLNFKQEKLSDSDLIRNFIFMQISASDQAEFESRYWRPFEELIRNELQENGKKLVEVSTDFYYRYLISKTEYFPRNSLYPRFARYIKARNNGRPEHIYDLANELKRYVRYYLNIVHRSPSEPAQLQEALDRFSKLDIETVIPLLLHLYSLYNTASIFRSNEETQTISLDDFCQYLRIIESYVIRRSLLRKSTRNYGLDFSRAIQFCQSHASLANFFLTKDWPNDEDVCEQLLTFPIYHHEDRKARLILEEIEKSFSGKEYIDLKNLSLEHILPQSLTEAWIEMLGQDARKKHSLYLHTLGNLTLTAYNSELARKPFREKKEILLNQGKAQLNNFLESCDRWSEIEIRDRTRLLAAEFIKLWPIWKTNSVPEPLAQETAFQSQITLPLFNDDSSS